MRVKVDLYGVKPGEKINNVIYEERCTEEYVLSQTNMTEEQLDEIINTSIALPAENIYVGAYVDIDYTCVVDETIFYCYNGFLYFDTDNNSIAKLGSADHAVRRIIRNAYFNRGAINYHGVFIYNTITNEMSYAQEHIGELNVAYINSLIRLWTDLNAQFMKINGRYELVTLTNESLAQETV